MVEVICYDFTIVPDAFISCLNYKNKVHVPFIGAHVTLSGSYVLDKQKDLLEHGWMEIHPVTNIKVNWFKTVRYWLSKL